MAPASGQLIKGVLPYQEILRLCGLLGNSLEESQETGPIQPCLRRNVRSASYDMRLGTAYYFSTGEGEGSGVPVYHLVPEKDEHIVLQPNQFVVVSSFEQVCLPEDIVGHLTLKQDILLKGLIMGSQSQIDAGYSGWIYPLLYNLTDTEVTLQLKQSIIRLELVRLEVSTRRRYAGDYQRSTLSESLKSRIGSSLADLRRDVERQANELDSERKRLTLTQGVAVLLGVAAIALPLILGIVGGIFDTRDRVSRLEGDVVGSVQLQKDVGQLERQITSLQCQMRELKDPGNRERC